VRSVRRCDSAKVRFVGKSVVIWTFFFNKPIQFYLSNTTNLRHFVNCSNKQAYLLNVVLRLCEYVRMPRMTDLSVFLLFLYVYNN